MQACSVMQPSQGSPPVSVSGDRVSDPTPELLATAAGDIAVTREGPEQAPAILCLHGIPGSSRDFRYLAPQLDRQLQVLRIEMPGFGSSPAGKVSSISGWAEVVVAVVDALGLERCLLLGHSFGGGAAQLAAARLPSHQLAGLVLISSMGPRVHRGFRLPPLWFRMFAVAMALPLTRPLAVAFTRQQYARRRLPADDDWRVLHRQLEIIGSVSFSDLGRAAAAVTAPTLVFHAHDDHLVQHAIAVELAGRLPRGELVSFSSGGHHLQKTRAREIGERVAASFAEPAEDG